MNQHVHAGDAGGARAGVHDLDLVGLFADHRERIEKGGAEDDRGAMLIVVEHRDVHAFAQGALDHEAFRRLDVLQVDAAEARLQAGDDLDQLFRVGFVDLDVEDVDAGELLEQHALAFHDRLRGQRTDVAQAEHGGAVGDDCHQVAARGHFRGGVGVAHDFFAGKGHARRIGQRQFALGDHGLGRDDLDLARRRAPVIVERCLLEKIGIAGHGAD